MPKYCAVLLAVFLCPQASLGQTAPELITDRPDFTESPVSVSRGSVQLEMGSTWAWSEGANNFNAAEPLVRWGALDALEVRLGLPEYVRGGGVSGVTDATLGAKLALGGAAGWQVAVIGDATLPTGDSDFGLDGTEANMILAAGRDLGERWSLGTQLVGAWASSPGEITLGYTAVLGFGLSERVSSFAELALSPVEEGPRVVLLHHGYSLLVAPRLQLDVHGGLGLSDAAPEGLVGLGLSTRFPR